jgi:multiple antibiotic resistance protein
MDLPFYSWRFLSARTFMPFFSISPPVVQVGGGLLVAATGWRLLDSRADQLTAADATPWAPDEIVRRAFYPLTLPLTVGPGSISVAITLGANTTRTHIDLWAFITAILIAITLVAVSIYVCYRFAENMARLLGRNGTSIFLRLSPSSCFASVCRFSGTAPARCWAH